MQRLLLTTRMAWDSESVAQGTLRARECGPSHPDDGLHSIASRRLLMKQHSSRELSSPPAQGVLGAGCSPRSHPSRPCAQGSGRRETALRVGHPRRSVAGMGCAEATWVEEPTAPPTGRRASGWRQDPREGQATPTGSSQSSWPGVAAPSCLCPFPDAGRRATPPRQCGRWPWEQCR